MVELAQEDHPNVASRSERKGYQGMWALFQYNLGVNTTATHNRYDYSEAISMFRNAKNEAVSTGVKWPAHIPLSERRP